jgi:hypothetical protein
MLNFMDDEAKQERRRQLNREAQRRWRERNREKEKARHAAWYAENKDYHAEWRAKNRAAINERQRSRRAANPEAERVAQRARWAAEWAGQIKYKYGITADEYDAMLTVQGGECALCGRDGNVGGKRLAVDHCHDTGTVRGLLCNPCNTMLGNARDNVDLLAAAIQYILAHRDVLGGVPN